MQNVVANDVHQSYHNPHAAHLDVVDDHLPEAVGQDVTVGVLGAVSDAGHGNLALEATPGGIVDTPRLPPARLKRRNTTLVSTCAAMSGRGII